MTAILMMRHPLYQKRSVAEACCAYFPLHYCLASFVDPMPHHWRGGASVATAPLDCCPPPLASAGRCCASPTRCWRCWGSPCWATPCTPTSSGRAPSSPPPQCQRSAPPASREQQQRRCPPFNPLQHAAQQRTPKGRTPPRLRRSSTSWPSPGARPCTSAVPKVAPDATVESGGWWPSRNSGATRPAACADSSVHHLSCIPGKLCDDAACSNKRLQLQAYMCPFSTTRRMSVWHARCLSVGRDIYELR